MRFCPNLCYLQWECDRLDDDSTGQIKHDPFWNDKPGLHNGFKSIDADTHTRLIAALPTLEQLNRREITALLSPAPMADG